jgi:2-aminoadipate transaminase
MDDDGIIPEKLEKKITELTEQGRPPKFVYIIPDFQNPSGINLSLKRRQEVLDIASRHDLLIVEDSPYRELRFRGELIPSLRSLSKDNRVMQMKTFSKIFCPGFRIGWLSAPPPVIDKLVMAKQGTDLCTSAYTSMVAAYLLRDGHVERQVEIGKKLYAKKVALMLESLDKFMPKVDGIYWSKPEGGMFLWVRLPEYIDTVEMIPEAVEAKVAYVIGSGFYADGSGRNEMRLNYSYPTEEQIVEGIKRLAGIVRARVEKKVSAGK